MGKQPTDIDVMVSIATQKSDAMYLSFLENAPDDGRQERIVVWNVRRGSTARRRGAVVHPKVDDADVIWVIIVTARRGFASTLYEHVPHASVMVLVIALGVRLVRIKKTLGCHLERLWLGGPKTLQ
jgi:hypothetical protein